MSFETPPPKRQQVGTEVGKAEINPFPNQVNTTFNINKKTQTKGSENKVDENFINNLISQQVKKIIMDKKDLKMSISVLGEAKQLEDSVSLNSNLKRQFPFNLKRIIEDPNTVVKKFGNLPKISLAWYLIGGSLHLWNYKFDVYSELEVGTEQINTIGLIRATPGILSTLDNTDPKILGVLGPEVEYLVLFGFETSFKVFGASLSLINNIDQFRSFNMDIEVNCGFEPSCIFGTETGRVFIGGKYGSVSEFVYRKDSTFFFQRYFLAVCNESFFESYFPNLTYLIQGRSEDKAIISMSIDEQRRVMYTLSKYSEIKIYDLGSKPNELRYLETVADLRPEAMKLMRFSPNARISLTSIHAIPKADSNELRLVAVTNSGASIYYSSNKPHLVNSPTGLNLFTARPPRGVIAIAPSSNDPVSHYNNGVLIIATPCNEEEYNLVFNYLEKFPMLNKVQPLEAFHVSKIAGPVYGIYEAPPNPLKSYVSEDIASHLATFDDLKAQYYTPSRKFNVLTPKGVEIVQKKRPVDQLLDILSFSHGGQKLQDFVNRFSVEEVCSMCLSLLVKYPLSLVEMFPMMDIFSTTKYLAFDQSIQAKAVATLQEIGGYPSFSSISKLAVASRVLGQPSINKWLNNSTLFAGAITFVSHILAPVWNTRIVCIKDNSESNLPPSYAMAIPIETLNFLVTVLQSIIDLLKEQPTFVKLVPKDMLPKQQHNPFTVNSAQPVSEELVKANEEELNNFEALKATLEISRQCAHFFRILKHYGIDQKISEIPHSLLEKLREVSFSKLLMTPNRPEIVNSMMSAVALTFDSKTSSGLIEELFLYCLEFCNNDIIQIVKGNEQFNLAKSNFVPHERAELLRQSLIAYESLNFYLPPSQLKSIVENYISLGFQSGALSLIVTNLVKTHNLLDRAEQANSELSYVSFNPVTPKTLEDMYALVKLPLEDYLPYLQKYSASATPPYVLSVVNCLSASIASTNDTRYHDILCEWLVKHKVEYVLLDLKNPSIEHYLRRRIDSSKTLADFVTSSILLTKYYTRRQLSFACAKMFVEMASTTKFELKTPKRLEYLQAADFSLKQLGCEENFVDKNWLKKELDETIALAHIQVLVYNELTEFGCATANFQQVLPRLDSKLFSLKELYQNFAKPEHLYASQLKLLEVLLNEVSALAEFDKEMVEKVTLHPDHYNLIVEIWASILDMGFDVSVSTTSNLMESLKRVEHRVKFVASQLSPTSECFMEDTFVAFCLKKAAQFHTLQDRESATSLLQSWATHTMLLSGIPVEKIFNEIFSMINVLDPLWLEPQNFNAVLHTLHGLLQTPNVLESCDNLMLRSLQIRVGEFAEKPGFLTDAYQNSSYILSQLDTLLYKFLDASQI